MKSTHEKETTHYAIADAVWWKVYLGCAIAGGAKLEDAMALADRVMEKLK